MINTKAGGLFYQLNKLGMYPSATLYYTPGSEHNHPTISMLGVHGGRLYIYIYIIYINIVIILLVFCQVMSMSWGFIEDGSIYIYIYKYIYIVIILLVLKIEAINSQGYFSLC